MKKIFLFIAFLWISLVSFAQDGVNFEHLSFREALDKAKSEQKYVFMDCYTSWCGPCRQMATREYDSKCVSAEKSRRLFQSEVYLCKV